MKEFLVVLAILSSAYAYEVCSQSGSYYRYCEDGYYCCSSTTCCQVTHSVWRIVGGCIGGVVFLAVIITVCCCVRRRRQQPGTIVTNQYPQTTVASVSTGVTPQMNAQQAYPQNPYGNQPAYGQPMAYGQPPASYGVGTTDYGQQNFAQPPPAYTPGMDATQKA